MTVAMYGGKENKAAGGLRGLHCVGRGGGLREPRGLHRGGASPSTSQGVTSSPWGDAGAPCEAQSGVTGDRTRIFWGVPHP